MKWSPEQISGWLKNNYSVGSNMYISHEFIQSKGIFNKSLRKHLRSKKPKRKAKNARSQNNIRGQIVDPITIRERPAEIEDRAIPGHWEGDLICGSKNSHMATLVERKSRFTLLVKVNGKDTFNVVQALKRELLKIPLNLRRSLTWDRGVELADHKKLSIDTNINVYFCDPRSPWQRGTNENTNRLLRQYFPKKTDLSIYEQDYLNEVARELNQRPRKILNFASPADSLQHLLQ
jgi:IS30 family transposase